MNPVFRLIAAFTVLILGGCGAVGVLEEENTDLHGKVDSLGTVQHSMKQRVGYLEQENIKLDNRNKQLKERLQESGSLTPQEYTITDEKPRYAAPVNAQSAPQGNQPPQEPENIQAAPQSMEPTHGTQAISPNPGAQPWRAEQKALQTGAANPQLEGTENWSYNSQSDLPADGYTYKNESQPGYTYNDNSPAVSNGGYTYNNTPQSASSGDPNWRYNNRPTESNNSDYSRKFDERSPAENAWGGRSSALPQNQRRAPSQGATPQAAYERQAQRELERAAKNPATPMPQTGSKVTPVAPLPPAKANVSRSDAARKADYSYLAKYQKGLDAYKDRNYRECISTLTDLAATAAVNNTSDNCDFWIAESYYALRDYNSARVYYSRVVSYPRSDKADEALARLRQLP